ncbi:hypothetical protein V9L05_22395 (plasmid) [Bernardetia sp. Wsw4-3y2]|uniref:hypothetical protein n=1 Tax=Bernardetia sp. Wsw4-3y2 TaxID=3127471 RepID=UPI0030CC8DB5
MTVHTLGKEKHSNFLAQNRIDPITGDLLKENDEIVICASCKSAFLVDSWEYMDKKHCEQSLTLKEIPVNEVVRINLVAKNKNLDRLAFYKVKTVEKFYKQKTLVLESGHFIINKKKRGEIIIYLEEIDTIRIEKDELYSYLANSFLFKQRQEDFYNLIITTKYNKAHKVFISEYEVDRIERETNFLRKYNGLNHIQNTNIPLIISPNEKVNLDVYF